MIGIALAGIYSFASKPLSHSLLEDFLNKLNALSNEVANLTRILMQSKIFITDNS
jgi:hypothetical protein